jgi:NodT family efflux transporter outer membrane factor (OMF) lipoprotein
MKLASWAANIALVCASGCAQGPDYRAPTLPALAVGPFVSTSPLIDATLAAPDAWWQLYEDDALSGLVVEALTKNADLRVAVANLSMSRAAMQEAQAGRYPSTQLFTGTQYGRSQIADSIAGTAHKTASNLTTYVGGLDVSYELDLYGRVARVIEASAGDADAVEAARDAVRVLVAAETTRAYATLHSLGHELNVANRSADLADEAVELVVRQALAGGASEFDVARAKVLSHQVRAQIPALEGRRRAALFELTALLGRVPADAPVVSERADEHLPILALLPVGDGGRLIARRPDIRQAERRLAAATARIGVATATLYPRVSLGANLGLATNDILKGSNAVTLSVGPLVSWTFPNQAIARSRIAQSNAAAEAALGNFDSAVLRALKEIEQAISTCDAEAARRRELALAEVEATTAYRLSIVRRREGALSQLDLLTAEQTMLGARAALASADTRLVDAQISLFKALGGGWQSSSFGEGKATASG